MMVLNPFKACQGSPTFQEEYRHPEYKPGFIQRGYSHDIVGPDTPYVAVAGTRQLYFIDTRHDPSTAAHIKAQIEHAFTGEDDEYIKVDELKATAEVRNRKTGQTTFVFDPPYARVLFAAGINQRNPDIKLPEHKLAGDWLVTYSPPPTGTSTLEKRRPCTDYQCDSNADCRRMTFDVCTVCVQYRLDDICHSGTSNAIGICHPACGRKVDTPRHDGETDAEYYQRMDKLHWGDESSEPAV